MSVRDCTSAQVIRVFVLPCMSLGHRKLAAWYHQLGQQLEAGLPVASALRSSRGTGLPDSALEEFAREIEAGRSLEAAFAAAERWLPLADRLVLSAAAGAGRMPNALKNLAGRHAQLGAIQLRLVFACLYPLGMLHAGLLILPVVRMIDWEKGFTWDAVAYTRMVAMTIGSLWAAIVFLGISIRRQHPAPMRLARMLPFIGGYLRLQGLRGRRRDRFPPGPS